MKKINLYAQRLSLAIGPRVFRNETNFELCNKGIRDIATQIVVLGIEEFDKGMIAEIANDIGVYDMVFN